MRNRISASRNHASKQFLDRTTRGSKTYKDLCENDNMCKMCVGLNHTQVDLQDCSYNLRSRNGPAPDISNNSDSCTTSLNNTSITVNCVTQLETPVQSVYVKEKGNIYGSSLGVAELELELF